MTYKSVVFAVLVAAVCFGAVISGCNRDRNRNSMSSRRDRSRQARPAEVLSASAYRPPARGYASIPAYAQPRPMPAYAAAPAPATYARQPQPEIIHPTPDLVVARAVMTPMPLPPPEELRAVKPAPAMTGHAPIPELEPVRRIPMVAQAPVPHQDDRLEIQRALAPLRQTQAVAPLPRLRQEEWVSSPATAMRNH